MSVVASVARTRRPSSVVSLVCVVVSGVVSGVVLCGCPEVTPDDGDNENEVITTVTLTFTPSGGGDALVFAFDDPENDGDPVIDDVVLDNAVDYDMTVGFTNKLSDPPEEITDEVNEEHDVHQVFVFGSGVTGPASAGDTPLVTHAYDDVDGNDLPVGLKNTITTDATGSAELSILLRHMPPENDTAVKVAGLADDFKEGGESALPGSTDASVTFPLTVE